MEIKLNLASKPYLNRQSVRRWISFACTIVVLLLLFNVYYLYQNYRQLSLLDNLFAELETQVASVPGAPATYSTSNHAAAKEQLVAANELVSADQFRWTHLLSRFEELVPMDVSLRSIRPDFKQRTVHLTCAARDVSAMTRFIDNLLESDDLNQAYLENHAEIEMQSNGRSQILTGFSLQIREAF